MGKVKFPLLLQDSHLRRYSIKTLYHLYISDLFWSVRKMLTALFKLA